MTCRRIVQMRRGLLLWPLVGPTRATARRASVSSTDAAKDVVARFGRIDRSVGRSACALRCNRPKQPRIKRLRCRGTEARNATLGSDDQATSSTAVEANRPLKTVLDARTA